MKRKQKKKFRTSKLAVYEFTMSVQVLLQLTWLGKFQRENKPGVQTTAKLKEESVYAALYF